MPRIPSSQEREDAADLEKYAVHTCAPCQEENIAEFATAKCQVAVSRKLRNLPC
jgi:hypothetical protein